MGFGLFISIVIIVLAFALVLSPISDDEEYFDDEEF